jgi:phosphopantetheine adenylyltransferase
MNELTDFEKEVVAYIARECNTSPNVIINAMEYPLLADFFSEKGFKHLFSGTRRSAQFNPEQDDE